MKNLIRVMTKRFLALVILSSILISCYAGPHDEKHFIKCLPFDITTSGEYVLARDFVWSNPTKSALTVRNAKNVKISFEGHKIASNAASSVPLLLVEGSSNVQLNNVYLQAIGNASNASDGIKLLSSADVTLNSPILIDLASPAGGIFALSADEINCLDIMNLSINNTHTDNAQSIFIYNSENIRYYDGCIKNGSSNFRECSNIDIQRLNCDNTDLPFPSIRIDSFEGLDGSITNPPVHATENIKISNCVVRGGPNSEIFFNIGIWILGAKKNNVDGALFDYPINNVLLENNIVKVPNGIAISIDEFITGFTIRSNQILSGDINVPLVEFDVCDGIDIFASSKGVIENNTITSLAPAPGIPITGTYGNLIFNEDFLNSEYVVIQNNLATGFSVGFADNLDVFYPFSTQASCTVLRNNVSVGNKQNYNLISPTTIFEPTNVDGCTIASDESILQVNIQKTR